MAYTKEEIAKNILNHIDNDSSVNLGIGMPTLVAQHCPPHKQLVIHSENGVLGVGDRPYVNEVSATLINAGKETITIKKGASFFDSSLSFGMIRGSHIDYCILGGMQVDAEGSLANWKIPGKKVTGMGGAMDLASGAKNLYVMMSHFSKDNKSKLVKKCSLPLTGKSVVSLVFTELGVFKPTEDKFKIVKAHKEFRERNIDRSLYLE